MEESERKQGKQSAKEATSAAKLSARSAQEHAHAADSTGNDGDDVDVCSEKFNPLLALYSPTVKLPFPNARRFNNVAEYESALKGGRGRAKPENVEKRRRKAMKGVVDQERIERLKKLMVNNPVPEGESSGTQRRRKSKPVKNVLTRMPCHTAFAMPNPVRSWKLSREGPGRYLDGRPFGNTRMPGVNVVVCQGSPLGELYRFVQERIRVKVHIRTFKGLRGVCSGFIVAFDRFWNMAMVDVDETYREPLLGQAFYHEKALTVTRLFEKLKLQESAATEEVVKTGQGKGKDGEAQTPASGGSNTTDSVQKKAPQKYGKVHTRHINQLFIRGENVVLVSPQTL